jgi:hypothetical protein
MKYEKRQISLGFTEEKFPEGQHILYIFNDDAERRRTMAKFFESGLLEGEKLLYLVDSITPDELTRHMEKLGVNIHSNEDVFTIAEAAGAYCPHGCFSCQEMLDIVSDFYETSLEEGYPGSRGTGEMTWALKGMADGRAKLEDLLEYEVKLTGILKEYPYTACCQYDARRFDGATIMDVLNVHPVMIVQGQLVKNPFYVNPQDYLEKFIERQKVKSNV